MVAVGDFVLVESLTACDMEFGIGEVICVDEHAIVVKKNWQVTVENPDRVSFAGTRKQATALKVKVDAMLEARSKAMEIVQEQVHEIAGQHALAIRKLLKQQGKA